VVVFGVALFIIYAVEKLKLVLFVEPKVVYF